MLLGQKLSYRGWCKEEPKEEDNEFPKNQKTEENGYGPGSDKNCPLCNDVFNPVCGINGVTYSNLCKLKECARIDVANHGPCGIPDYKKPEGVDKCVCRFRFAPVCGTDFVTYQDRCVLNCAG